MALSGLRPSAPRVLPVIGCALQAGSGLAPSGVIKNHCVGEESALSGAMIYRLTAENCREAAYKMAPQAPYFASAAILYNYPGPKALNPSGRRQPVPNRTLGAQGVSPAAPSTLARVSGRQPSGVQVSTVVSLSATYFAKEISLTGTTDLYIIILLWCAKNGTASM